MTIAGVLLPTSMGTGDAWTNDDAHELQRLLNKKSTGTLTDQDKRDLNALLDKADRLGAPVPGQLPIKTQWGWTDTQVWKRLVSLVGQGGTNETLLNKVPTKEEAVRLIIGSGGRVDRIEGPHEAPNPHRYNHINYTTQSGKKGTVKIQDL